MDKQNAIRNTIILSHSGCGKTTLAEDIAYLQKLTDRFGSIDAGNTLGDFEPEEIKRKMSISTALISFEYKDYKINLLDAPGYIDFIGEVYGALQAVENALLLVSANSGVEVGTEKYFKLISEKNLATLIFVNKMDKENANFDNVLSSLEEKLKIKPLPLVIPMGESSEFKGVIDVLENKAYIGLDTTGANIKAGEVPAEFVDKVTATKEIIKEIAAEGDDEILNKYLEEGNISDDEILKGLKNLMSEGKLYPVLCGSALKGSGISLLIDKLTLFGKSPKFANKLKCIDVKTNQEQLKEFSVEAPFSAFVFKTTTDPYVGRINFVKVVSGTLKADLQVYNANKEKVEKVAQIFTMRGKTQNPIKEAVAGDIAVLIKLSETVTSDTLCEKDKPVKFAEIPFPKAFYSMAVQPKSRGDEEKMSSSLQRLMEEDLTFTVKYDAVVKQTIITGTGDLHLDVILDKIKRKFGVEVNTELPKIPYKETIQVKSKAQGKYKRQSGGRGQYGDVWLELEPLPRGEGFLFVDKIVGGAVPKNYIPSVEKGVKEAMSKGVIAGCPVVDIKITMYDGSYHDVDSSDMAFQIAGSMGFKNATQNARVVLLEPIANVSVTVPQDYMGDIMGDLNSRRGRVLGTEANAGEQTIIANVPLSEMIRYAVDLRSMTQGRGNFEMNFDRYEEVPSFLAEKIIEKSKKEKEEES